LFSIGAFALIFDEHNRVLLCHRRDMDLWNLPGGGVEREELIFRLQTAVSTREWLQMLQSQKGERNE
jgi:8-oxo-dGTP pyrophosphatase MutT (NUDIX family)